MKLYVNLKYILFLGCISFCVKAFANERCDRVILEHIQPSSTISFSLLTFIHQENNGKQSEYIFIDGDGAASLLTILHILQTTQKPISNIIRRFINHQASYLKDIYRLNIDRLVQEGALYAEQILGDRIAIIDRLLQALRNNNTDLSDITNDLFTHLSQNHYQHQYEVHYHTDYSQETQLYASSQGLKGVPIISSLSSSNIDNIIGYHFFNRCPIEVDFENLASHLRF